MIRAYLMLNLSKYSCIENNQEQINMHSKLDIQIYSKTNKQLKKTNICMSIIFFWLKLNF